MGEYERGFVIGLAHGRNLAKRRGETTMSDKPDVVAEAGDYELTKDGYLLVKYEGAPKPRVEDFPALLADAVKRVREEMSQKCDNAYGLVGRLTERIKTVEADIGRLGNAMDIRRAHVTGDIGNLADRVSVLEARQDRDDDSRMVDLEGRVEGIAHRLVSLEAKSGSSDVHLGARVAAIEMESPPGTITAEAMDKWTEQFLSRVQRLDDRLAAAEDRTNTIISILGERYLGLEGIGKRVSALEARQQDEIPGEPFPESWKQDEVGEGAGPDYPPCACERPPEDFVRRELAHEMSDRLYKTQPGKIWPAFDTGYSPQDLISRLRVWIEHEFGGGE